ncbi:MAG: hypothetical protein JO338_06565 [Aquitalea sp.]|nr:hypothetical protein [Aquitalea sp.]
MSKLLSALIAGLLFGLGLLLSGMSNPAKVLGFLDVTGRWDPSLALVMAGAIGVAFFAFRRAERQSHSLLGEPMQLPDKSRLTVRLVLGSVLFGIGWGLAGICPGPGLILLGMALPAGLGFVLAMLLGMLLLPLLLRCCS